MPSRTDSMPDFEKRLRSYTANTEIGRQEAKQIAEAAFDVDVAESAHVPAWGTKSLEAVAVTAPDDPSTPGKGYGYRRKDDGSTRPFVKIEISPSGLEKFNAGKLPGQDKTPKKKHILEEVAGHETAHGLGIGRKIDAFIKATTQEKASIRIETNSAACSAGQACRDELVSPRDPKPGPNVPAGHNEMNTQECK